MAEHVAHTLPNNSSAIIWAQLSTVANSLSHYV